VAFTAKDVQALRQATGVGFLDAKKALESCDGDMEEARKWLRVQGKASAAKRADREAGEVPSPSCETATSRRWSRCVVRLTS